jgi:hypothetical protein
MGWEKRKRGGTYYTRSRKINGRVVREYVGTGPLAELAAEMDSLERRRREEDAEAWRAERERLEALEAPVARLCEITEALAHDTLLASGYRRHNRGEWRKRRVSTTKQNMTAGSPMKTNHNVKEDSLPSVDEIRNLLRRAESGDETALPVVRKEMDLFPKLASQCGDLARIAQHELISVMSGKNLLMKEALPRKLEAMREELAGPTPTPLEKIMVERVAACWLAVQHAELLVAQQTFGNVAVQQIELYQRRLDHSHRRYLSAIRTLAQIRKLGPAVQVNITEQQVNVAR